MMRIFLILISISFLCLACESPNNEVSKKKQLKQLYYNGKIYTVNEKMPWAEAMLIENGIIQFIGSDADAKQLSDDSYEKIDLKSKMLMPGIHDIHMHPLEAKSPIAGTAQLNFDVLTAEEYIPIIREAAKEQLATDWVLGWGHSIYTLLESKRSPREILDEAIPDKPIAIMEQSSHSQWVNSRALELAGINKNSKNPPGGIIVKDPVSGEPNGILFDAAGDLIMDIAWKSTDEAKKYNYEGLLSAFREINQYGITSVCEARTYWKRAFHEAWLQAEDNDELTVRAILGLWAYPNMNDQEQIKALKQLYRNNPNDLLRISQIKVYSDGIIVNTTAALVEPYLADFANIPGNTGLNYFSEKRLYKYISELGSAGFDFHIHAIGDRAVNESLNAIEKGQSGSARHRLTHIELVQKSDLPRFKQLNVTADIQLAGDFTKTEHLDENEDLIGPERSGNLVPLRDLYDSGARIVLSSDWDVSTINPFVAIQNAMERKTQGLPDLHELIKAYTINAAYVMRQENRVGSLKAGMEADFIILDKNIFDIPVSEISKTRVLATYLKGEMVYQR